MDDQREFAVEVVRRLQQAGHTALWAGGCVRDLLLGLPAADYDVATTATPEQVRTVFGHRRTLTVGASFGVIIVQGPKPAGDVEVATFRTEGPYLDGRRPQSVAFATPEEDAQRRDFTINGMFYDPLTEQVLDYVGGQRDLELRQVRAIGDAHARFTEDKLRMLRAVRITARFGFDLDRATGEAVRAMAREISVVSQERIAQELKKMLVNRHRARAVQLAADLEVLLEILPEMAMPLATPTVWTMLIKSLEMLEAPRFELAMAVLLRQAVIPEQGIVACCRRLRLSIKEEEQIQWLVQHQNALQDAVRQPLAKFKRLVAHPQIDELISLARVYAQARGGIDADAGFAEQYLRETPRDIIDPPPLVNGEDLKQTGLRPGPAFKTLLETVRDAQLEGLVTGRAEALDLLRSLAHEA